MSKPRLLYVVGTYPTLTTTFIRNEIAQLRSLGFQLDVISVRRPPRAIRAAKEYADDIASTTYLLPVPWLRLVRAHLSTLARRPRPYLSTVISMVTSPHPNFSSRVKTLLHLGEAVIAADYGRRMAPDHVHAHFLDRASLLALTMSRLLDVSYSVTAHANDIYVEPVLLAEKLGGAAFNVTVSIFNKRHLAGQVPELDPSKIVVLHPWVDINTFSPPGYRRTADHIRIVSVGRLVEKKGHADLIVACRSLDDRQVPYDCTIIGDGPLESELQDLVSKLGIEDRVRIAGSLPPLDVQEALRGADVFVLACRVAADGDRDGIPVALAEAMAMELPVVSTDIVGIAELVRRGTGWLVPQGDPEAIADALATVHGLDGQQRGQIGIAARSVVAQDFDLKSGVTKLADLFVDAVAGRRTSRNEVFPP